MPNLKRLLSPIAVAAALVLAGSGLILNGSADAAAPAAAGSPLAGTAGCGRAPTLASGTHTIQSSGQARSYILELPAGYDASHPYRLIFGFHWLGGTAQDVDSGGTDGYNWSYYGLRKYADAAGNGQRHDLRRAPGHQQRLGQHQRPGRDLLRRHAQPVRIRTLYR